MHVRGHDSKVLLGEGPDGRWSVPPGGHTSKHRMHKHETSSLYGEETVGFNTVPKISQTTNKTSFACIWGMGVATLVWAVVGLGGPDFITASCFVLIGLNPSRFICPTVSIFHDASLISATPIKSIPIRKLEV